MNIKTALRNDRICSALTGLKVVEFYALVNDFSFYLREEKVKANPNRKMKFGLGRHSNLKTTEEKMFFTLFFLKSYPTLDILGVYFNLDKSNCSRNLIILIKVLELTLKRKFVLPARRINSIEELIEKFPEIKDVFIDGTERRTQKPKKLKKRGKLYSGKRKTTTLKNIVVSDENRKILVLSPTKSGRRHDKRLVDKLGIENIPKDTTIWVDTGFQGIQKQHPNTQMPVKKTKNNPLTYEQKQNNKLISGIRVISEHAIGGIKRFRSVADVYRSRRINFEDSLMLVSAGLWNYHLAMATTTR